MRKLIVVVFIGIFLVTSPTYADVEAPHSGHQPNNSEATHELKSDGHEKSTEPQTQSGHEHGGEVIETPPNYPVLTAFVFLNAAFLLLGFFLKYRARKESATL